MTLRINITITTTAIKRIKVKIFCDFAFMHNICLTPSCIATDDEDFHDDEEIDEETEDDVNKDDR